MAQLATVAGDTAGAAPGRAGPPQLAAAVNARAAAPDGIYVDGVDPSGAQSSHASQEANALALAYGVVPAADLAAVGAYVAGLGIDVGPESRPRAPARAGGGRHARGDGAPLTDASIPGWAHIVAAGGTFTWEVWRPSDLIGDSMSHGWGSSALVAMQETLLGVTLAPARRDGTVQRRDAPPSAGLDRAGGSVPTIAGPRAGVLAAPREGHDDGPHRARQRDGDGAAARQRAAERPRAAPRPPRPPA